MSNQPSSQTTVQKSEPPAFQIPYLKKGFSEAKNLLDAGGPAFTSENQVAPLTQDQLTALGLNRSLSTNNPLSQAASGLATQTLQGDYLQNNPYLDDAYNSAARAVTRNYREAIRPGVDASFAKAGRLGSGLFGNQVDTKREGLGRTLNDLATQIYFGNYNNERNRQVQTLGLAPSANNLAFGDIDRLLQGGLLQQDQAQNQIAANRERFDFEQNRALNALKNYASIVGGNVGSTTTSTSPLYKNRSSGLLGGGLLGLAAAKAIPGISPLGGLLGGGLLGGLL